MQNVALIDYGAGNLRSVERALEAGAAGATRRSQVQMTRDPSVIAAADRVVLPGQGAFDDCMRGLRACEGAIEALEANVLRRGAPFLGICVGMQLLAETGLEHGVHQGLGWIGGVCRALDAGAQARVPHMGWNEMERARPHALLAPLGERAYVYFMHSFVLSPPADAIIAETCHGERFASAVARDNIAGVQFHPEKSQRAGIALLSAFMDWSP